MPDQVEVPLHGYSDAAVDIPVVDSLTDKELEELNNLLPWKCFVADRNGRRFGKPASKSKRSAPTLMPDHRIELLNARIPLTDMTVLEVGCFEGVHTTSLAQLAKHVKACDSRIVNVVKTAVRCALFQVYPTLFMWNIEESTPGSQDINCDVLHHVGVLYHLLDPVSHLIEIAGAVRRGIMLDTHYARAEEATSSYEIRGRSYAVKEYRESGYVDVFSGMYPMSRWLTLDDLSNILKEAGFAHVEIAQRRDERNGARALIFAER